MGLDSDLYSILNTHTWSTIRKPTFYLTEDKPRRSIGDFYIKGDKQPGGDQLAALDNLFYQQTRLFTLTFFEGTIADLDLVESNVKNAIGSDSTASTVWEFFQPIDDTKQITKQRVLRGRRTQWVDYS